MKNRLDYTILGLLFLACAIVCLFAIAGTLKYSQETSPMTEAEKEEFFGEYSKQIGKEYIGDGRVF